MSDTPLYDSRPDTWRHIERVRHLLSEAVVNLLDRSEAHDQSKLVSPERECFDEFTPKLKDSTYGSDEYKSFLAGMGDGLAHHYAHNSHHPEHYADGIQGMTLLDLVEMLCDWKAAGERHADGSMERSLRINAERFAVGPQLGAILGNTAREMGWSS